MANNKIKIINREDAQDKLSAGGCTQILLNGEPMKFVKSLRYEVEGASMAKITIEMYGEIEMDINVGDLKEVHKEETDLKIQGKQVNIYTISNFFPSIVAFEEE